jgi:hypothetical protein
MEPDLPEAAREQGVEPDTVQVERFGVKHQAEGFSVGVPVVVAVGGRAVGGQQAPALITRRKR